METDYLTIYQARINKIQGALSRGTAQDYIEAANLSLSIIHDTVGGSHPLYKALDTAINEGNWQRAMAASKAFLTIFEEGGLLSPRLVIAHEIEGDLLNLAQTQASSAEIETDINRKRIHLAIASFLSGAALEDGMRRICDANRLEYDPQQTSISKLQNCLYQPSKQIELISNSENKHITVWGDTRNKADHGRFEEITQTEVITMIIGVRAFLDDHLPK
jgi:hypothetical protein